MLTEIQGVYRDGKIQLDEVPRNIRVDTPVIVTFLTNGNVNLSERGINEIQAADLRARLTTFVEEWDSPEMDIYDNYDAANPTYKRGNVVLVLLPHSNLKTAKIRPALVVQADNLQTGLPQLIIAMITSRMFRANHPCRVTILLSSPEGKQSGLLTDSVVMTNNLATVSKSEIDRSIGSFPMG